jgi:uncharacterized membrane protein YoaK (UPF0700 family)
MTTRRRDLLVVVLAFVSGYTDGIGFLALGGVFTSVMTGNMVLLGLSVGRGDVETGGRALGAILTFIAGAALGARIAGVPAKQDPVWPRPVNRALALELAIFTASAVGWFVTVGRPGTAAQFALLLVSAVALGVQSSTVQRFGVSGLSTTYLTGTLTTAVIHMVSRRTARGSERHWNIIGALVLGAAAAAVMHAAARPALPVPQLVGLALVLAFAVRATRREDRATAAPDRSGA